MLHDGVANPSRPGFDLRFYSCRKRMAAWLPPQALREGSGSFPGGSGGGPEFSREVPGGFPEFSREVPGGFPEFSRKVPGRGR